MLKKSFKDLNRTTFYHKKYGRYDIIEYINCEKVKIKFHNTGYEYYTSLNHIENNEVRDRLYSNVFGGVLELYGYDIDIYKIWYNMLYRANMVEGSYKDVNVCPDWMYFQNFYNWAKKQIYHKGWHLDKDIIIRGNKTYSPDTCCFIPSEINTFFEKSNNALGYGMNRNKTKYVSFVRSKGKKLHLGTFDTKEEAQAAYLTKKRELLDGLIEKYSYCLSEKVILCLKNYYNNA